MFTFSNLSSYRLDHRLLLDGVPVIKSYTGVPVDAILLDGNYESTESQIAFGFHYFNNRCCDLPPDQWRKEAARWFEASFARIQFNLLEIVRRSDKSKINYEDISDIYKGMCKMVKFKSVEWRIVSVWDFLALLALAAAIILASEKTENGE